MLVAVLGDVHGDFEAMERAFALEPVAVAWLCVGDVATDSGLYPVPSRPFSFIKGNNEDFDVIARLAAGEPVQPNLRLVPNGQVVEIDSAEWRGSTSAPRSELGEGRVSRAERPSVVRVAGLGGTFAPKWYDTPPEALPDGRRAGLQTRRRGGPSGPPHGRDDKRRHFVRAEVEACLALRGVDLFLTHEAPRPYWAGSGGRRNDAGKTVINEILATMRPRLHVFGHHHKFSERLCEGVPSIGLPLAADGYLLVETDRWTWSISNIWQIDDLTISRLISPAMALV